MEGTNLFSLLNSLQNNPERQPVDLFRLQGNNKGQNIQKNRSEETQELSFRDVLRNISDNSKDNKREKPVEWKDVKNKLDDIEKKLDKLSESHEGKNNKEIETVKAIVKEIKKILAGVQEKPAQWNIEMGDSTVSVLSYMAQILEQLGAMLDKQNFGGSANSLDLLKNQLQDISGKMGLNNTSSVKTEETALQSGMMKNTEDENKNTPDKVVVIDKRTKPEEAGPAKMNNKENKNNSGDNPSFSLFKNEIKENKTGDASIIKVLDKENTDKIITKENTAVNLNKMDIQSAILRQTVSYASPVSKATLEALMQNITGRALVTLKDGKSELRMNLIPPELGRMSMKFSLEDGLLLGKIVVSTPEAKMLFDQNMGDLQRALQQAGINIGGMDVSLSQQEQDNSGQASTEAVQAYPGKTAEERLEEIKYSPHSLFESSINFLA